VNEQAKGFPSSAAMIYNLLPDPVSPEGLPSGSDVPEI
jgi:hypothetical protein